MGNFDDWANGEIEKARKKRAAQERRKKAADKKRAAAAAAKANPNVSKAQMDPVPEGRVRHDAGFGTKDDTEGMPCREGCGTRITGGLDDIKKHYADFHPDAE